MAVCFAHVGDGFVGGRVDGLEGFLCAVALAGNVESLLVELGDGGVLLGRRSGHDVFVVVVRIFVLLMACKCKYNADRCK